MSLDPRSLLVATFLAVLTLTGPAARAADLPPEVTPLLEQCLAAPDNMPSQAVDALQQLVDRNDPAIRDLFAREAIRIGGGGDQGSAFKKLVYDAVDRRQFSLAERLAAEVADEMGDGVELVIRTGSSGSRHMQLNNQATGAVRYDTLISDDDISFLGPQAEEAAKRFNDLKQARGLKNARVKGFSLSSITDPTSYDLLVQQIRDPDAFVGAAGFGKIRQEIVEKGGAVILTRQGKNMVAVAQTVQDYVSRNAGSTLAEIMDVAAIASDLKKFGPLTMYASAIRQMGHGGVTEREKVKYLLRIYASMQAAGSFGEAASFGGRQATYFSELGEQMMAAYRDKTGKAAQALLRRHDLLQIQLDAFESVMLSTTRKLQSMVAQAEREAGRGAVNIARHPELRRMIHELAAGFSLLHQTGHSRILQDVVPGILKSLGSSGGREASLLYKVLYTAAFDAATLTAEAAEQGVTRGVSSWTRARSPAGLIEGMAEAGQNGRQARLLLAEVGSERLPGKAADGARELQRIINQSNGDTFLWKMLSNQTAQKFLIEGVALAPFAAWTMYQEWSRGEMKDLSDAAFVLIDFIPGGMTTKKLGTEGLTPGTVLMFAKEALYFSPAWPFVLAGDVLYLSWTVGGAVQLQAESEGLVDVLTYNGEFDDSSGSPVLIRLALPGGTAVARDEIEPWLFNTKAVRVKHTLSGLEYYINNLSEKSNNVLDNQFMANDPGIEQMRMAVQQHLDAINWDDAARYFHRGDVGMALGAYVNYLAGFEFVVKADKGQPWARLYEDLKKKMVERRDVVAKEHMVPQLIQMAEQKRATLDAAKTLAEDLGKLQQTFERMRGSTLGVDLVKEVTDRAEAAGAKLGNATAEERQLAAGKYWQDALASYRRILEISETIVPAIVDRTGYTQAKPLGFVWTGDPAEDLRKAEQSKAGFAADLARVTRDVREIKGSEAKVDDSIDRQALGLLAEVTFPWRNALDSQDKAEPSGGSFDKEYEAAQDKVRALYAESGDLQARVDKGTRIEPGQNVMPLDKAVSFKLVVDDPQLRRAIADGSLGLKWSTEPGCTLRPRDDRDQVNITTFQPEPVTVTLTFEQGGVRAAKATARLTLPVSIPDNLLTLTVSPATVKAGGRLSASAEIDDRLLGGRFHYRWSCSNCQVDAADRASVGVAAPESEGSGSVGVELLIEDKTGQTRRLASKSASFQVAAADKKDGDKDGKDEGKDDGKDGGKVDPTKPSCSYEYGEWGECVRASKTQTRRVTAKNPAGCVERGEPKLEQGCTPPPTEEEKRLAFLSCLCRACGGSMGGYFNTGDGCGNARPCACWGVFNCWSTPIPRGDDLVKSCYAGAYGVKDPDAAALKKAAEDVRKENRKHLKPLQVKLNHDKCPLHVQLGDIINFSASIEGGLPPHKFSWSGEGEAKDGQFTFARSRQPASFPISVTVNDDDGNSATASCTVVVDAIEVKIEKTSPAEDTIPVGGQASFRAVVTSGANAAGGELKFQWQPHPEVQFGDAENPLYETTAPNTTATYLRTGTFPMWVQVLKKMGETYQTVGESDQLAIEVVNPQLALKADKPNPMVGETVTITVEEQPKMSDELLGFWWEIAGEAANPGPVPNVPNSRAYSYKPKNDKPVTVTAHAKSKQDGDELASERITLTARKANVSVTGPRIAGPAPMIWKPGVGLVSVERQVAEHQRVEFAATVSPDPGQELRYQWTVDPSGCSIHSPYSKETGVTCSNTGSYTLTAAVKNADGAELGSGAGSLSVSISQAQIDSGKKKADASKQLDQARQLWGQGRHDEAVAAAEAAAQVDKELAAPVLNQFSQGLKQQGWDALNKGERDTAIKRLEQAVRLNPNDADAKKKLADARDHVAKWPQVEAKVRVFDDHIANKRIWSAQREMLAMQDILRTMAAGQSSSNPTWKRVMDDFNTGIQDYNRFSQEKSARHTQYFKEENYPEMLRNAESMRERELSPADEKECQSRIDFAKRYLKAAEFGRQASELTRQGRHEEALQAIEQGRAIDYKQVRAAAEELSAAVKRLGKEAELKRDFATSGKYYALALKVNPQDGEAIGGDVNAKTFQRYADQVRAWQREIEGHIQRGDWDKSESRLEEMARLEKLLPGQPYPESLALYERQKNGYAAYKAWVEPLKQEVGRYMQRSCLDRAEAKIMEMRARHLIWMDQDWTRVFMDAITEGRRTCSMGNVRLTNNCGRDCELDGGTGSGESTLGGRLVPDRTSYTVGDTITLSFSGIEKPAGQDWISLFATGAKNEQYGEWYYLKGQASGSVQFKAPGSPGDYEFRLFLNWPAGGYKDVARSASIRVAAKDGSGTPTPVGGGGSVATGGASLTLDTTVVEPNAPVIVRWSAPAEAPDNTWVGLIPSGIAHGSTATNDQHDLAYQHVGKARSGSMTFTAPAREGSYDLRMSNPASGRELASATFTVQVKGTAVGLTLPKQVYAPNEKVVVRFNASAGYPRNTWVGLIPSGVAHGSTAVNDQHDMAYRHVDGRTTGEMEFTAPAKVGSYDLRMNETTNNKEVASVTFTVAVPTEAAGLTLPKNRYAPNEAIKLRFTAPATFPRNAWVGLVPSGVAHGSTALNDQHDVAYRHVDGRTAGDMEFTAPAKVGRYDLRMNETTNDKEVASIGFTVAVPAEGAQLWLAKGTYKPGEQIRLRFQASPLLPRNAWVGLVPSGVAHGSTALNDQHDVAYRHLDGKASGELAFTAPGREGPWDFRLNETTNDKEVIALSFRVDKNAPASGSPVSRTNPGAGPDTPTGSGGGTDAAGPGTGPGSAKVTPGGAWQLDANGWAGTLELSDGCTMLKIERGWETLTGFSFSGATVSFTRPLTGATQRYTGTLSGDTIQGTFTQESTSTVFRWSAKRQGAASGAPCAGVPTPGGREYTSDTVTAPPAGSANLRLDRSSFAPGEAIAVHFSAPGSWPGDAWVGIVPSAIPHGDERQNDNHDITYQYLNKRTSGTLTFTAPAAGNWDFRLHDTDGGGKEYASASFQVTAKAAGVVGTPGGSVAGNAKGHWGLVDRKLELKPGSSECYPSQVTGREGDLTIKIGSVCGENGQVTVQARWSEPPLAIAPGERLRIDASLSATVRGTNRGIDSTFDADFDKLDVACGYTTRGPTVIDLFAAGVGKAGGQRRSDIAMPDFGTLDSRTTGRLKLRLCSRHWHQYYFYEWREGAAPPAPPAPAAPGGRDYTAEPIQTPGGAVDTPAGTGGPETTFQGHRYRAILVPGGINWANADRAARGLGGYLAVITSAAENDAVYNLVRNDDRYWYQDSYRNGIGPWLGGLQPAGSPESRSSWRWVTGEPFSYANWGPNQPDNAGNGEDRLQLFGHQTLKSPVWNDVNGNLGSVRGYIVEFGEPAAVQAPVQTGKPSVSFDNGNIGGVSNKPTQATTFSFSEPRVLTLIQDYHWNYGRGATPGTIGLRDAYGTVIGPWQSEGSPGQGGVPNAYWTARPNVTLPAGTYTVVDSDPATWSHNGQSGNRGFTRVESYPAGGDAVPGGRDYTGLPGAVTQPPPTAPEARNAVIYEVGNVGAVANDARKGAKFTLTAPHVVTLIQTYHWNRGRGAPPGNLALKGRDGRIYGPWPASGSPGQGGVANAYWTVRPNLTLPAGVYVVVDSDKATWSHNAASDGVGFTRVEGYPVGQTSAPSPSLPPPGTDGTVKQVDDVLDAIKSLKGIFGK